MMNQTIRRVLKFSVGCVFPAILLLVFVLLAIFFAILYALPQYADKNMVPSLSYLVYVFTSIISYGPYATIPLIISLVTGVAVFFSVTANFMADIIGFSLLDIPKRVFADNKNTDRIKSTYFPFEVITEPADVLPKLMPGPGLIPDYRLPYHRRREGVNTTEEIRTLLLQNRKILVSGIAGIGKTREVGKLLSNLIDEGFTLLYTLPKARFDAEITIPDHLKTRLVFLFDDIHLRCVDPATFDDQPDTTYDFLKSIEAFIVKLTKKYSDPEIFVIFISRIDIQSWGHILYPSHPLWREVICYELPLPDIGSQTGFIMSVSQQLDINITDHEANSLAQANDGTFRNLAQNLFRAKSNGTPLDITSFMPKQGMTWASSLSERRTVSAILG